MEKPDVVVGTPSRVLAHLNAQNLVLHSSLETLVVDEADLLFSFGFEADLKNLLWWEHTDWFYYLSGEFKQLLPTFLACDSLKLDIYGLSVDMRINFISQVVSFEGFVEA